MNGSGLILVGILVLVLIGVGFGSSQIQADLNQKIEQMTNERNATLQVALEAKGQRDAAIQDREAAVAQLNTVKDELARANSQITAMETEQNNTHAELTSAIHTVSEQRQEIERLRTEEAALQQMLEQARAAQPIVPVTSGQETQPQSSTDSKNSICLPVQADKLPNQLGVGLAVLVGMMALGSGGYIVYRHDTNRKYTVRMTREQIREYARFQRERSSKAG